MRLHCQIKWIFGDGPPRAPLINPLAFEELPRSFCGAVSGKLEHHFRVWYLFLF